MLKRQKYEIPVINDVQGFYNWKKKKTDCLTSKNASDSVFSNRAKAIHLSSPALVHLSGRSCHIWWLDTKAK